MVKLVKEMLKVRFVVFMTILTILVGCGADENNDNKNELHISAAISLSEALIELKEIYEKEHPVSITYHFGGSGKLAQQIEQGAPFDIYISANEQWMKEVMEKDLVDKHTYTAIINNKLVFIKRKDLQLEETDLNILLEEDIKQIAIAHPDTVPAGYYTKQALENYQLWEEIDEKIIFAQDVRQVLTYVETGNAEVGFVYASDLFQAENVDLVDFVDENLYEEIIYPSAVRKNSDKMELAKAFLQFLTTAEAQKVFEKYGFSIRTVGDS